MNQIVTKDYFKAATPDQIMDVIEEFQAQYPMTEINIRAYGTVLEGIPIWALHTAKKNLLLGMVDGVDASFCPPAPKIAQVANGLVKTKRKTIGLQIERDRERLETNRLMSAPEPTNEARANVKRLTDEFQDMLKSNDLVDVINNPTEAQQKAAMSEAIRESNAAGDITRALKASDAIRKERLGQ